MCIRDRPQGLNSSRQLGAGLGVSLFTGIVQVAEERTTASPLNGFHQYKANLGVAVRDCFELGTALCLTAAVVALLTLPRHGVRAAGPEPDVSGAAPAGTAGSPGSSGR